jgi:hypothetical protein
VKEKLASAGALMGAVLASSCCWLPLLLIAVGAGSGIAVASTLDKFRIPLAAFALAALGTAWYFTYRKPKSKQATISGPAAPNSLCPCCGGPGKKVAEKTVAALLTDAARGRMTRQVYYLCQAPECALVYYASTGSPRFMKEDLRVRVGFKEPAAPHLVCYCFEHSVEGIEEELRKTASTTAPESIKAEIKAGRCACEVKNPQGTCCLGNVNRAVHEAQERIAGKTSAPVGAPAVQCMIAPEMEENHADCCRLGREEEVNDAESCCTPGAPVARVKSFNRITLWILTPIVLAFVLFPHQLFALFASQERTVQDTAPVTTDEERFVIRIEGMT